MTVHLLHGEEMSEWGSSTFWCCFTGTDWVRLQQWSDQRVAVPLCHLFIYSYGKIIQSRNMKFTYLFACFMYRMCVASHVFHVQYMNGSSVPQY